MRLQEKCLSMKEGQKMVVTNRWSKKKYEVWEISEKTVKLKREDGTIFEISKSEYQFNYRVEK